MRFFDDPIAIVYVAAVSIAVLLFVWWFYRCVKETEARHDHDTRVLRDWDAWHRRNDPSQGERNLSPSQVKRLREFRGNYPK